MSATRESVSVSQRKSNLHPSSVPQIWGGPLTFQHFSAKLILPIFKVEEVRFERFSSRFVVGIVIWLGTLAFKLTRPNLGRSLPGMGG